MANAAKLKGRIPYRGFHIGLPGSGKTGGLASLANAGYKLRILDMGGNPESLLEYVDERALANIDIVTLADKMKNGDKYIEAVGIPTAFNNANKMLIEWKYTDEDGEEVNLGRSTDWGQDTIVVVDDGSGLAAAVFARALKMNNKTKSNVTSAIWGHAVSDYNNFIDILRSQNHHVIVNIHQQMIGPQDFLAQGDDSVVKEKKLEAISQNLIPTRWYPIAVTKPQAQNVHGKLPIMLHFEKTIKFGKEQRVIDTVGGVDIDVKIPGKELKKSYNVETGMAEIFEALGHKAPGLGK